MHLYNVKIFLSLAASALLGVGALQAQSYGSFPNNVLGGSVTFTSTINPANLERTASGKPVVNFPIPIVPGHPADVVGISPGFASENPLALMLPIDPQSQPVKAGDFAFLGGISVSFPQDKLFITYTDFREDLKGNLFAVPSVNGKAFPEIEVATAAGATFQSINGGTQFTIKSKLLVPQALAQFVNGIFHTTVLTPGQEIATQNLVADVIN
jgi:hypothetical protein